MIKGAGKRRKLGQHFLADPVVAEKIVSAANLRQNHRVLEVGPGEGALTRALLATGARVYAVEMDRGLFRRLSGELGDEPNFSIQHGNALQFDLGSIEPPYHVVSNLPYSVSVALVKKFIESVDRIESMIFMTQAEVARRLAAKPGDSAYGTLSIYCAYHCRSELLFGVPSSAFKPPPKVESAVIRLEPLKTPPVEVADKDRFFGFVRAAFTHRRKTIRNNIRRLWADEAAFVSSCRSVDVDPMTRPQDITLESYATLFTEQAKMGQGG